MQHPQQLARRRPQGDPESGIVLLMVVFLTFLLLLSLAIAAPEWAHQLKRQKEIVTIHNGEQYERAIQLYYRKFHRYPSTIKELLHSNNIRFLRQKYTDPLTGKDDWKLVLYGHAHVHPLGLFGQPLSDLGAVQSSGGMYAVTGNSSSGSSGSHQSSGSGSDTMGFSSGMSSSPLSSSSGSIFGNSSNTSTTGSTSTTGGLNGSSSLGSPTSSSDGFKTNTPFVGVVPPIKGHSIVDYRAQDNYDRWEFNYDPVVDQLRDKVSILGGTQSDLNGATSLNGSSNNSLNGSDNSKKNSTSSSSGDNGIFGNSGSSSSTGNSNDFLDSGSSQ